MSERDFRPGISGSEGNPHCWFARTCRTAIREQNQAISKGANFEHPASDRIRHTFPFTEQTLATIKIGMPAPRPPTGANFGLRSANKGRSEPCRWQKWAPIPGTSWRPKFAPNTLSWHFTDTTICFYVPPAFYSSFSCSIIFNNSSQEASIIEIAAYNS